MNKIPMTVEGFNRLQEEIKRLKSVDRPAVIRAIAEARTHGDLSENAEYHAARERQSFLEGRLMELEDKVARAEVIDVSKLSGSVIKFGATVTLAEEAPRRACVDFLPGVLVSLFGPAGFPVRRAAEPIGQSPSPCNK